VPTLGIDGTKGAVKQLEDGTYVPNKDALTSGEGAELTEGESSPTKKQDEQTEIKENQVEEKVQEKVEEEKV